MRILNLSFPDNSEIKYKISKFPDGQQDIVIDKSSIPTTLEGRPVPICITSRFNSFLDLELIICTTKALRRLSVLEIHLYIPYLLGARIDSDSKSLEIALPLSKHWVKVKTYKNPSSGNMLTLWVTNN